MITIDAFNLQPNLVTLDADAIEVVINAVERDDQTETVTYYATDETGFGTRILQAHYCDQVEVTGITVDGEHDNIAYFSTPLAVTAG